MRAVNKNTEMIPLKALTWVLLALISPVTAEPPSVWEKLQLGLSPLQVRAVLGEPAYRSRQIIAHRCIEQWEYRQPQRGRIWFECRRGEPLRVFRIVKDVTTAPADTTGTAPAP
ncbi:MAG: hypothetical protein SNJ82_14000 [Gemmataceae bacterium]